MTNVIQFGKKPKAAYPDDPTPRFVLEIYDRPGENGFDWAVLSDEPIDEDQLSDYLGDMFFTLNPDVVPEPSIFRRVSAFLSNFFTPWRLK